jgi:transposase InsO family protein
MGEHEKIIQEMALWRFGIISPLLHRSPDGLPLCLEIELLARKGVLTPSGQRKFLSPDTIRGWLYRYRSIGLAGLQDKVRKDKYSTRLPDSLQTAITKLRRENPFWTLKRILTALIQSGQWDGRTPGRSSFYRFASVKGLMRKSEIVPSTEVRSFQYPHFGDLWMADFLHGPRVRVGTVSRKVYLHAMIDDATRYIVAAGFHLAEDTEALLCDLMLAVRRFGIPRRFYTDNGAAFRSKHLQVIAARMAISLPHTPPGQPRGRGKIERWFRSVREQFLTGKACSTLAKLNEDLQKWIAQYHQTIHSSLGISPLNRKDMDAGPPLRQVVPVQDIDALFRMETDKTIQADGCIRFYGRRFEIKDAVPGQKIKICYLPWNKNFLWAGEDRVPIKPLDLYKNAIRYQKPNPGKKRSVNDEF